MLWLTAAIRITCDGSSTPIRFYYYQFLAVPRGVDNRATRGDLGLPGPKDRRTFATGWPFDGKALTLATRRDVSGELLSLWY